MTKDHPASRMIRVGLVLVTLVASLIVTTRMVSVSHAADPATYVPLTQYGQFPISMVGKLIVKFPRPLRKPIIQECSGSVLNSANGSVVDTAAHCFYNEKTGKPAKATNIQFCPQYHNGISPLGCWQGMQWFVSPDFEPAASPGNYSLNDYGFLVVSPLGGKTLQSAVGQGVDPYLVSGTDKKEVTAYGYPITLVSQSMYSTTGGASILLKLRGVTLNGPILYLAKNVGQQGASGGPWFYTISGTTYIIGHTSAQNNINGMISPLLGTQSWTNLFNQAEHV